MAITRCYRAGAVIDESFSLEVLGEHLSGDDKILWIDLHQPSAHELQTVGDQLGLHSLAVENAATERQRTKLDHYENHDFLSAYALRLSGTSSQLISAEIAVFITSKALLTVRKDEQFPIADRSAI